MTDAIATEEHPTGNLVTTLYYKKRFAVLGAICGIVLFFGTPPLVLQFHVGFGSNYSRQWVESMPDWIAPTMLVIGMGGGVLMILLSALAAVLIPSQVTREQARERTATLPENHR